MKKKIQDEINPLLKASDVVILLFYSRVGKYTFKEYQIARKLKKKVFVFFKEGFSPKNKKENNAYCEVLDLRESLENEGQTLCENYSDPNNLKARLRENFELYLMNVGHKITDSELYPKCLTPIPTINISDVIGRENELKKIARLLSKESNLLLVNGIEGVGKTTLVKAFVQKHKENYDHLIWIIALPTLKDALILNTDLLQSLRIKDEINDFISQKQEDEAIAHLVNSISSITGNNLFILDNVSVNEQDLLYKVCQSLPANWKLILTSLNKINKFSEFSLDFLSPDKARELFLHNYKEDVGKSILDKLLMYIGYHTLTIELLSKTLSVNRGISIDEAFNMIKEHELENKRLAVNVFTAHSDKEVQIFTHLMSLFDFTDLDMKETMLLKQFCILPSIEIEKKFLAEIYGVTQDSEAEFYNTLNSLIKKGFLIDSDTYLKSHQVLKEVALLKIKPDFSDISSIFNYFLRFFEFDESKDNPIDKFKYIEYGLSLLEFIKHNYKNESLDVKTSENLSLFLNRIGNSLKEFGMYESARSSIEVALQLNIKNFGEEHPNVASSQSNLAIMYADLGNYTEAKELLEKALQTDIKNFGEEHPNVARSQSNLATVYKELGNYKEAVELLEKALHSDIKNFEEEHPKVAIRQSNLASVYQDLGKYERATELSESAYLSFKNIFGEYHPSTKTAKENYEGIKRESK